MCSGNGSPVVLVSLLGVVLGRNVPVDDVRVETPPRNFIGEGTNELATALLQGFAAEKKNFAFSPLGYSVILAMIAEGARGETRKQLVNALQLPEDTYAIRQNYNKILESMKEECVPNKPEFKTFFYSFRNFTVDNAYKKILFESYRTKVADDCTAFYELDFDSEINKNKTSNEEEIEDVTELTTSASICDGSKDVAAVLTETTITNRDKGEYDLYFYPKMMIQNAFYFRGYWKIPFTLVKKSEKSVFHKTPSEQVQVTMMQTTDYFNIGSIPELDVVALEIPFEGDQYRMLVLLPNQRDGLSKLTADLTGFSLSRVNKFLINKQTEIYLPQFKIRITSYAQKVLQDYGLPDLFNNDTDLSGISGEKLKMGAFMQLADIQVDEGTSDTNFPTTTNVTATQKDVENFVADRPFIFFIRDHDTNLIIAAGKLMDPSHHGDIKLAS